MCTSRPADSVGYTFDIQLQLLIDNARLRKEVEKLMHSNRAMVSALADAEIGRQDLEAELQARILEDIPAL